MPTNDERREVAARLRETMLTEGAAYIERERGLDPVAAASFVAIPNLIGALNFDKAIVSMRELADRLADLIEPEERTCRNQSKDFAVFWCSDCGYFQRDVPCAKYCPKCGAKVVE